jgi:hypothetical protein
MIKASGSNSSSLHFSRTDDKPLIILESVVASSGRTSWYCSLDISVDYNVEEICSPLAAPIKDLVPFDSMSRNDPGCSIQSRLGSLQPTESESPFVLSMGTCLLRGTLTISTTRGCLSVVVVDVNDMGINEDGLVV